MYERCVGARPVKDEGREQGQTQGFLHLTAISPCGQCASQGFPVLALSQ